MPIINDSFALLTERCKCQSSFFCKTNVHSLVDLFCIVAASFVGACKSFDLTGGCVCTQT